ncbi:MAG TPA: DUF4136 domain-containing protein [Candidatus Acidoferrales bacterium]|nr:DUF4136 domain-containing protein [Candidatus Acidoferrales bacterium]
MKTSLGSLFFKPIKTLAVIGTLFVAGCASPPMQVDTGPIHARTFSFVRSNAPADAAYDQRRQAIHAMIQSAITRDLAGKGLSRVDNGGDVTVTYLIVVGNNVSTMAISDYWGYNGGASAIQDAIHQSQTIKNENPNYFEAGTLVIDIIDSHSFKLLKRATVQRPVLQNVPAEIRQENIQQAVDQALSNLRVAE